MQWRNTSARYGLVSVLLHWLVALAVFGLFGLGFAESAHGSNLRWDVAGAGMPRARPMARGECHLLRASS